MGVYLGLAFLPLEIESDEWTAFYDDILKLTKVFPLPLQRFTAEDNYDSYRFLLTRALEAEDKAGHYLAITGDAKTGQRAEQFVLYRDIGVYHRRAYGRLSQNKTQDFENSQLSSIFFKDRNPIDLFHEKTQGCPYHDFIWCMITLAENRFPNLALASGNLNARTWEQPLRWLTLINEKPLQKPLRLGRERLRDILAQRNKEPELTQKIEEEYMGNEEGILNYGQGMFDPLKYLDNDTLHRSIAAMSYKKQVVLTEETWRIIDQEDDPAILGFVLRTLREYGGYANEGEILELALSNLHKIKDTLTEINWSNGAEQYSSPN